MLHTGGHYNLPEYVNGGTKISKRYRYKVLDENSLFTTIRPALERGVLVCRDQ